MFWNCLRIFIISLFLASTGSVARSMVTRFSSGLIESYYSSQVSEARAPRSELGGQRTEAAIDAFLQNEFGDLRSEFQWVIGHVVRDATHVHTAFQLKYEGRSVVDRGLKLNVQHSGIMDSAFSNFSGTFVLSLPPMEKTVERAAALKARLWKEWEAMKGPLKGDIRLEPVVWIDPQTNMGHPAFDVRIIFDSPWILRRYIIHEETGKVLEEKQTKRNASASVRVFKVSPSHSSNVPDTVTLSNLNDTSSLRNSFVWVRRERITSSGQTETVEVTPEDYTTSGGGSCPTAFQAHPTPTQYNYTCTGSGTVCCNMAFDAVNAYYHISNFRSRIDGYLTTIGATVNWAYDAPKNPTTGATNTFSVLINPVSLDFNDPGLSDDANNALYVGEACRSDGSMDRCLVFLRPAALSSTAASSTCNRSSSTLYDLSREALVVAHEYQHYVTDMITRISFSSSESPKVGDAIHEGYSDYMAASYVTDLAGANVTLVGAYALQECTPLQRELSTLRVYNENDSTNKSDIHLPGLSWASAFWQLRVEYGREIADLLALKSQFYLSTTPGFIESIEAVVQADQALYSGAHVERIRTLFYKDITFTGKNSLSSSGVGELGFSGCAAVHDSKRPKTEALWGVLIYFVALLFLGRKMYFRRACD